MADESSDDGDESGFGSDRNPKYICFYRLQANLVKEGEELRKNGGESEPEDACSGCDGKGIASCFYPLDPDHVRRRYTPVRMNPNPELVYSEW